MAQLLLRLGAAKNALHGAIDVQPSRKRDRKADLTSLSDRIFFDYPAILNEWYTNPDYTDSAGRPIKLSRHGRSHSFDALVRLVRPDIDATEALTVLQRLRAIRREGQNTIVARSRVLSTAASKGLTAARMLSVVDGVLTTVERNLDVGANRPNVSKFYERAATNHRVDARCLADFQRFLLEQGDGFLQLVDDWLSAHSIPTNQDARKKAICRVGTGVYMFASE